MSSRHWQTQKPDIYRQTRKLSCNFQAHTVYVLIEHPLQSLLRRSNVTGRIAQCGTRLGSFDVRYKPRNAIKGQLLVDFVAEFIRGEFYTSDHLCGVNKISKHKSSGVSSSCGKLLPQAGWTQSSHSSRSSQMEPFPMNKRKPRRYEGNQPNFGYRRSISYT